MVAASVAHRLQARVEEVELRLHLRVLPSWLADHIALRVADVAGGCLEKSALSTPLALPRHAGPRPQIEGTLYWVPVLQEEPSCTGLVPTLIIFVLVLTFRDSNLLNFFQWRPNKLEGLPTKETALPAALEMLCMWAI